jgi:hypothetical protein
VFEEEDGDAVVGSPRGEQHIPLVKCRFHHKSSQNDQADAEQSGISLAAGRRDAVLGLQSACALQVMSTAADCTLGPFNQTD